MNSEKKKIAASGANLSMLFGAVSILIVTIVDFIPQSLYTTSGKAATIPYAIITIVIPTLILLSGGTVIYFAIKAIVNIRRSKRQDEESEPKLVGKGRSITAIVLGVLLLWEALGSFAGVMFENDRIRKIAGQTVNADLGSTEDYFGKENYYGFSYFNGVPVPHNKAVGEIKVHYYENAATDDAGIQSIFLPDSNLLTVGLLKRNDSAKTSSRILMKTDLVGKKLWSKLIHASHANIGLLNDSTVISFRINKESSDEKLVQRELVTTIMNFDGVPLDSSIFKMGSGAHFVFNMGFVRIPPNRLAFAGVFDDGKGDSLGRSFLFQTDDTFANQSLLTFPSSVTGVPTALAATGDGEISMVGHHKEKILNAEGSEIKREIRLTKVSLEGDILWHKTLPQHQQHYMVEAKITDSSEVYILMNSRQNVKAKSNAYGVLLKLDPNGELIWSKQVSGEYGGFNLRCLTKRPGGWIVTGNAYKMQLLRSWTKYGSHSWNTYNISLIDTEGEIEYEFDGGLTRFIVTTVAEVTSDSWAITGYGMPGSEEDFPKGKNPAFDIGILHYKFSS